jgi:hypothetical protein
MPSPNKLRQGREFPVILYAGLPLLVTGFLWATSSYELSVPQILASFVLVWIPWASYHRWSRGLRQDLPLFALIAAMYWLTYAVPMFWSKHSISLVTGLRVLTEKALTESLYLATIGVVSLWAGMKLAKNRKWMPSVRLDVPEDPWRWTYLRVALALSVMIRIIVPITALGDEGRQIIVNTEVIIPSVIFVILLRSYLRGRAIGADKFLLGGYFLVALALGLSSGWLGSFVGLGLLCIAAYLCERRKFPVAAMLIILPLVLFLQPGKAKFRERYWRNGGIDNYSESYWERVGFWLDASSRAWENALTDSSGDGFRKLSSETLTRLSLLQQTANVIETTPNRVPYQDGRLYSYLLVTFVPRFVWPDKPSANDANQWYQVSYQMTSPSDLTTVSIAVGTVTESYINFGWFGPLIVMFALGLLLGVFEKVLFNVKSGLLLSSIGVALLPGLISIESQMAVYISGLVQQIFFALAVLAPVLVLSPYHNLRYRSGGAMPYSLSNVKAKARLRY